MSVSELGINENSRVYIYDGTVCKEIKLWQGQETEDGCRLYNMQDYWALDIDFPSENDSSSKKVILVR